jgi:hypothetical protein
LACKRRELGMLEWLPELVLFEDCGGDWKKYLNVLYDYFKKDFINSKPKFSGIEIALKKHPIVEGKEATFWHLISEGNLEENRLPNLRRCERIRWPRPMIENYNNPILKVWNNVRKYKTNVCIWFEKEEYLVVLAERKGYLLLWTAYLVTYNHQKRKLQKEYEAFIKKQKPPQN